MTRGGWAAVIAATGGLIAPASASAALRFASPNGTGTTCSQAQPCDVVTAVNNAKNGDDVTIEPGTYGSPAPVATTLDDNGFKLTIHGQAGSARPVIISSAGTGIQLMGPGSAVSDLELDGSGSSGGIVTTGQETADRVIVRVSGASAGACDVTGTVTNSVCQATGSGGQGVFVGNDGQVASPTFRNDTIEATGSSGVGVDAQAFGPGASVKIALINSIVHGTGKDIEASYTSGINAAVTADHSNFATSSQSPSNASAPAPGSGTNQTTPPKFVNAAGGDFHELGSSPTVDAGTDSPLDGSLDADGFPRTMGAHTDIGAFEYPVPVCQTLSATTPHGQPLEAQLTCADPSGAPITSYSIVTFPTHGTLSLTPSGRVTYVPASGYSGADSFSFQASSSHGTGAPASATITVGAPSQTTTQVAPVVGGATQSHRRWREGNRLATFTRRHQVPVGTTFAFTLNEPASVHFAFTQKLTGRRTNGRCVAPQKQNRRKPKCRRTKLRGSVAFAGHSGLDKVSFQGRTSRTKRLKPGNYTLVITASNVDGQRSPPQTLSFTIVR